MVGALAAARREAPLPLTKPQESLVVLLDRVRDVEWVSHNDVDMTKEVKHESHQNAVLLYTRGIETEEKCGHCAKGAGG
ncbi:hypothetical protein Aspvir_008422 [Aspergillus viridinutans]|uniref:Uncharacterized protein n=1 Tax=Aspergillus viridinutans TaxID=75553 RepID=A0A9P3C370_ASPVI|nr:uncharacterized protein Aspvir_008422 [Aspergillus viridinutans]GIK04341.1 hypothetical protein Aspvir_008422 [Aspergillus viridinutans]